MGDTTKRVSAHFVLFSFHRIDVLRATVLVTVVGGARLKGEKAMKLNGRTVPLKQDQTLAEFLLAERFDGKTIAVELNGVIVARAEYETTRLTDEDSLEIVSFVGGG